jgi:endonuclease-3
MNTRREGEATKAKRAKRMLRALKRRFPEARCELDFKDPFQLLVAVVLSAQCTDVKVNQATPALFSRYPTPQHLALASADDVEPFLRTLGLFRNKARNLVMLSRALRDIHGGAVPNDRDALEALAGVGRKSASVVLANAFHIPALAVDTHVGRVSRRFGLTVHQDPDKVEQDLCALWPRAQWNTAHHVLIWHGRRICHARRPDCHECPLKDCPRVGVA